MAEIKSTMELVMERAARFEAKAGNFNNDELIKDGMRLSASYMRGEEVDFNAIVVKDKEEKANIAKGAITAFLRNIILPREEEDSVVANRAMRGIMEIGQTEELIATFGEMKNLMEQFIQHQSQLKQQLEEQISQQLAMMDPATLQKAGLRPGMPPQQHPKYAEEWQNVMVQLTEKYGKALNQHKANIAHAFND